MPTEFEEDAAEFDVAGPGGGVVREAEEALGISESGIRGVAGVGGKGEEFVVGTELDGEDGFFDRLGECQEGMFFAIGGGGDDAEGGGLVVREAGEVVSLGLEDILGDPRDGEAGLVGEGGAEGEEGDEEEGAHGLYRQRGTKEPMRLVLPACLA